MADTYCGKTCGQCEKKQNSECAGCIAEDNSGKSENCDLAICCKGGHHSSCYKCGTRPDCITYHSVITPNAKMYGKWIGMLFIIMVASVIASVVTSLIPNVELLKFIISVGVAVVYGLILLILSKFNHGYQIAGISYVVSQIPLIIGYVIGADTIWNTLLSILATVILLVAAYSEYDTHANALYEVDSDLADKWRGLWQFTICSRLAMVCGFGLLILAPSLGVSVILLAEIAVIVVEVIKFVHLYNTSKAFNKISER